MKRPKLKPFDSTHPIWQETYEYFIDTNKLRGVIASEYAGQAFCSECNWHGSYNDLEKNRFQCPHCRAKMVSNLYGIHREYGNTLIINEIDGIIIFSFIGFHFELNHTGYNFEGTEAYRIYTDGKEYEICKASGKSSFKHFGNVEMDYSVAFNQPDIYEYHNYERDVQHHPFIKSLNVLYERHDMSQIFSTIASMAARNSVEKTCPVFTTSTPDPNYLILLNGDTNLTVQDYGEVQNIASTAIQHHMWCGKCGKYHTKTEPAQKHSYSSPSVRCDCGHSVSPTRNLNATVCSSFIVDVEFHANCTVLRYCEFGIKSEVVKSTVMPTVDAKTSRSAYINRIYYVVCFSDGTVTIFDKDRNPISNIEKADFASHCVNTDLDVILENDENINKTGFIDFARRENDYSMTYFFGYTKTANAEELVACNLQSLIHDLVRHHNTVPAYILKNNGKLTRNTFSQEQIDEFAECFVLVEDFVAFMQAYRKDHTVTYKDFMLLSNAGNKNNIAEVYRKIPNAKFADVMGYIIYLNSSEAIAPSEAMPLWSLYLARASGLEWDLNNPDIAYPKSLKLACDVALRSCNLNRLTHEQRYEFEETARKINVTIETETHMAFPCKNYNEYNFYKEQLLNNVIPYGKYSPDVFTMVIINKKTNRTEYMIDIAGTFVGDELKNARLQQVYAFGNARVMQYGKVTAKSPILLQTLKAFNL